MWPLIFKWENERGGCCSPEIMGTVTTTGVITVWMTWHVCWHARLSPWAVVLHPAGDVATSCCCCCWHAWWWWVAVERLLQKVVVVGGGWYGLWVVVTVDGGGWEEKGLFVDIVYVLCRSFLIYITTGCSWLQQIQSHWAVWTGFNQRVVGWKRHFNQVQTKFQPYCMSTIILVSFFVVSNSFCSFYLLMYLYSIL